MDKKICCICGKEFEEFGNNPEPVKMEGRCCDNCNKTVVIPNRIQDLVKSKKEEN